MYYFFMEWDENVPCQNFENVPTASNIEAHKETFKNELWTFKVRTKFKQA